VPETQVKMRAKNATENASENAWWTRTLKTQVQIQLLNMAAVRQSLFLTHINGRDK
jgi:hypothetical protein